MTIYELAYNFNRTQHDSKTKRKSDWNELNYSFKGADAYGPCENASFTRFKLNEKISKFNSNFIENLKSPMGKYEFLIHLKWNATALY